MRIGCLHTAQSNIAIFEAAAKSLDLAALQLDHHVRTDLLARAEQSGGLTPAIIADTQEALQTLCSGNDAVVLTCSTLGPCVDLLTAMTPSPVIRVDAALAAESVAHIGRVIVLCAVETTMKPTTSLFLSRLHGNATALEFRLIAKAWDYFKSGDQQAYYASVAQAADLAFAEGANVVALAQASMQPAAHLVKAKQAVLTSPVCGLRAAISLVRGSSLPHEYTSVNDTLSLNTQR